jgi:hypothetical protein
MHLQPAIVVVADVAGTTPPWRMGLLLLQLHFVAAPAAMHGRGAEAVPRWWMCSSKLLLGCWRLGLPPSRMWGWRIVALKKKVMEFVCCCIRMVLLDSNTFGQGGSSSRIQLVGGHHRR